MAPAAPRLHRDTQPVSHPGPLPRLSHRSRADAGSVESLSSLQHDLSEAEAVIFSTKHALRIALVHDQLTNAQCLFERKVLGKPQLLLREMPN